MGSLTTILEEMQRQPHSKEKILYSPPEINSDQIINFGARQRENILSVKVTLKNRSYLENQEQLGRILVALHNDLYIATMKVKQSVDDFHVQAPSERLFTNLEAVSKIERYQQYEVTPRPTMGCIMGQYLKTKDKRILETDIGKLGVYTQDTLQMKISRKGKKLLMATSGTQYHKKQFDSLQEQFDLTSHVTFTQEDYDKLSFVQGIPHDYTQSLPLTNSQITQCEKVLGIDILPGVPNLESQSRWGFAQNRSHINIQTGYLNNSIQSTLQLFQKIAATQKAPLEINEVLLQQAFEFMLKKTNLTRLRKYLNEPNKDPSDKRLNATRILKEKDVASLVAFQKEKIQRRMHNSRPTPVQLNYTLNNVRATDIPLNCTIDEFIVADHYFNGIAIKEHFNVFSDYPDVTEVNVTLSRENPKQVELLDSFLTKLLSQNP